MRTQLLRHLPPAVVAPIVALAAMLTAAPAQATTFCVPTFDPARCPNDGLNVAQANLETAMQSDASDGEADTVVVAPGTYTDPESFDTAGSDALTIEGAGAGGAADPTATRLTTSSTGNIYVVNLAASLARDVVMRDLTVVVPPSLPDNQGAAMQVAGDTLERVDVEIANPYSDAMPSWPEGGAYKEGTIYPVGNGVVRTAIGTGNVAFPGQVSVEDATLVEPLYGHLGAAPRNPRLGRAHDDRASEPGGLLASEGGQVTATNSVVLVDGAITALNAAANTAADAEVDADHLTIVQEGPALGSAAGSSASSTGKSTMLVENSILRGFGVPYSRVSTGGGEADLTIRYSNPSRGRRPQQRPGNARRRHRQHRRRPAVRRRGAVRLAHRPRAAARLALGRRRRPRRRRGGDRLPRRRPAAGRRRRRDRGPRPGRLRVAAGQRTGPRPVPGAVPGPGPAGGAEATSAGPAQADTAVALRILGKRVRIDRRGIARLRLRCPAAEQSPPCAGTRSCCGPAPGCVSARRGSAATWCWPAHRFEIAAGKTRAIGLRVPARKLRLLRAARPCAPPRSRSPASATAPATAARRATASRR